MDHREIWSPLPTTALSLAMMALAILMAVLPGAFPASGVRIIAVLIFAVGMIDLAAAIVSAPQWARLLALLAGLTAIAASVRLLTAEHPDFLYASAIVTVWLLLKAVTLVVAAFRAPSFSGRDWLLYGAIANLALAFLSLLIVSSLALAILIFGPAPELGKYSLIPALSMLLTGISAFAAARRSAARS